MKKYFIISALFILSFLYSANPKDIVGYWLTQNGKSIILITREKDTFSGKIVWLKEPRYPKGDKNEGKEKMDLNNPDIKKRTDKLIGLKLLWDFKFKKDKWAGGKIYDPENGKTYFCKIKMNKKGNLIIKGSIDKWGIVGRSTVWKKVNNPENDKSDSR